MYCFAVVKVSQHRWQDYIDACTALQYWWKASPTLFMSTLQCEPSVEVQSTILPFRMPLSQYCLVVRFKLPVTRPVAFGYLAALTYPHRLWSSILFLFFRLKRVVAQLWDVYKVVIVHLRRCCNCGASVMMLFWYTCDGIALMQWWLCCCDTLANMLLLCVCYASAMHQLQYNFDATCSTYDATVIQVCFWPMVARIGITSAPAMEKLLGVGIIGVLEALMPWLQLLRKLVFLIL